MTEDQRLVSPVKFTSIENSPANVRDQQDNWKKVNKMIRENNEASYMSGNPNAPFMDHNMMSDLT